MGWQLSHAVRGPRLSSPHTCWPTWNGGERTITLFVPMQHCEWHSCSHKHEGANVLHNVIANVPSNGSGENQPTVDSGGSSLLSPAADTMLSILRATEGRSSFPKWRRPPSEAEI